MDGLANFLRALGPSRIIAMGAVTAGLVGFFFFITMRLTEPQLGLLYSNLEMSEAASIMQRLDGMNVRYDLQDEGRTILVPQEQISTLRVQLAGEGLGGSIVGYEIFDRTDNLGTTNFVQNLNRVRAIEGELSRTISEINSVSSARVHIVMPERELFSREERKPSASIVLRTARSGLSMSQVSAIQHLVAAAIPGLDARSISIVDQNGSLLARGGEMDGETAIAASFEERRLGFQNRLRQQIESLLEKTVGFGRVRAEVSVEMDLNRITTNSEIYDPDGQVVRSTSTIEESSSNQQSQADGGEVSVGNNLPDAQPAAGATDTTTSDSGRTEEVVNYEISKTLKTEIKEGGEIQRVSVAVLVDGIYEPVAGSDPPETAYRPRTATELEQLANLVRSAIGFNQARGDQVEVVNMPFIQAEAAAETEEAFSLMGLSKDDLAHLIEIFVFGIVSILVLLLVVRPIVSKLILAFPQAQPPSAGGPQQLENQATAMQAIAPPQAGGITSEMAAAAAAGDQQAIAAINAARQGNLPIEQQMGIEAAIDVASIEGKVQESAVKKVGDIVQRHPDEAAAVVRQWLYSD